MTTAQLKAALEAEKATSAALKEQNEELLEKLDELMTRLSSLERSSKQGNNAPTIITTSEGLLAFHGSGINVSGEVCNGAYFKAHPEMALELFKNGSQAFTRA